MKLKVRVGFVNNFTGTKNARMIAFLLILPVMLLCLLAGLLLFRHRKKLIWYFAVFGIILYGYAFVPIQLYYVLERREMSAQASLSLQFGVIYFYFIAFPAMFIALGGIVVLLVRKLYGMLKRQ